MNTKVKGEAIKEGSIRYEALDKGLQFVPSLSNFVKHLTTEDVNTTIEIPYSSNLYIYVGSKNEIITLNPNQNYTISDYGDSLTITSEQEDANILLTISNMKNPSFIEGFNIYIYKNLNKIRTEFLPSIETPTPDWNAQEGEAGYIKNRPFYDNISNIESIDFTQSNKYYSYSALLSGEILLPKDKYLMYNEVLAGTATGEKIIVKGSDLKVGDRLSVSDPEGIYNVVYSVRVIGDSKVYIDCVSNGPSIAQINEIFNFQVCDYAAITLNDKYIPDTVIKTTPQTLSDTDKNQVLANLGIDPVVWKYMCNPYVIQNEEDLPDELINVIIDSNGYIKNIASKILLVQEADECVSITKIKKDAIFTTDSMYYWGGSNFGKEY